MTKEELKFGLHKMPKWVVYLAWFFIALPFHVFCGVKDGVCVAFEELQMLRSND